MVPRLRSLEPIPPTVAVDPGHGLSKDGGTGIVAVDGTTVVWATLLRAQSNDPAGMRDYFVRVAGTIDGFVETHPTRGMWQVVVEYAHDTLGRYDGRKSRVHPGGIAATAWIGGAVWAHYRALAVPPAKFGKRCPPDGVLDDFYPVELIGRRKWEGGDRGSSDHLRAAYDLAFAAYGKGDS